MEKLIRDNKVGVLISSGFGSGFHSTGIPLEVIFNPDLILLIENNKFKEAITFFEEKWPNLDTYAIPDLEVVWVPVNSKFVIHEYDGLETIVYYEDMKWITV
jgi:hypothetical protein